MTSGVRVRIGGAIISDRWDGSDLVAVGGLTIRWGRTDPYDSPEPSILTLQLVDRRGTFITDADRVGQEVIVEMLDPAAAMFRGTLTSPKATRRRMHNPLLNATETVWIVTLTASDPLAALGMAIFPGDALDGWREGAGGWSEANSNDRLSRLYAAGASGLVEGFEPVPDIGATPRIQPRLNGQEAADARTALQLVRQVYQSEPLGVANYDPVTNMVTLGRFAASSTVSLILSAGVVRLQTATGLIVPASKVAVSGYDLESDVANAIDAVQVSYYWYGKDPAVQAGSTGVKRTIYTEGFREARTDRYSARTRRVLKLSTQFITLDPSEFVAGGVDHVNRFVPWLLERVTAIVNKLNGQLRVPQLTFDARRLPLPAALEAVVYRPTVQAVPLYFSGSVFNGMPGVGPQFQIIGGTLTYDGGWKHDVTVCATGPATPSTLTVAQLTTNTTAALGDVDPDISLADLGLVTIGLA